MRNFFRKLEQIRLPILSLIAGCLVACSIDLPTPVIVQKDASVAFPCQTRGCGCKNADQCWSSCCCFSDSEKLAWAKANGVTPPDWFRKKMASETKPVSQKVSDTKKSSGCCCCKSKSPACEPTSGEAAKESNTVGVRLSVRQQRGCNGQLDYQLQHLVYLPLDIPVELPQMCRPFCATPALMLTAVVSDLPTPPPRAFLLA